MIRTDGARTIAHRPPPQLPPEVEDLARALAATRGITLAEAVRILTRTA
jgi:hypothetical protein